MGSTPCCIRNSFNLRPRSLYTVFATSLVRSSVRGAKSALALASPRRMSPCEHAANFRPTTSIVRKRTGEHWASNLSLSIINEAEHRNQHEPPWQQITSRKHTDTADKDDKHTKNSVALLANDQDTVAESTDDSDTYERPSKTTSVGTARRRCRSAKCSTPMSPDDSEATQSSDDETRERHEERATHPHPTPRRRNE